MFVCVCMCLNVCMYVCVYLCVCTDHSSDSEYLPQRAREERETELATQTYQDKQNDRPLSTELRGVGKGRGRGRGRKTLTVPAPNNAHSGMNVHTFQLCVYVHVRVCVHVGGLRVCVYM